MKKQMWMVGLVLAVFPLAANAADGRVPRHGAGSWKQMTYDAQCPAALRLLDRLNLTDDQQKALDKIYARWSREQKEAYAKAHFPRFSRADLKDPAKMKDYAARRAAAFREARVPLPADQIKSTLTPEQTRKLAAVSTVLADWSRRFTEYLAGFDKQLDAILGPAPTERVSYHAYYWQASALLDRYAKGAGDLAYRLGLAKEQRDALQKVYAEYRTNLDARIAPGDAALNTQTDTKDYVNSIRMMLYGECERAAGETARIATEKILTEEQRGRLAKAVVVVAERDKGLAARYAEYAAKVNAVLPAPAQKPDEPTLMHMPGGGVSLTLPSWKAGAAGEGRTIIIPEGDGGGVTVIVIGGNSSNK